MAPPPKYTNTNEWQQPLPSREPVNIDLVPKQNEAATVEVKSSVASAMLPLLPLPFFAEVLADGQCPKNDVRRHGVNEVEDVTD